MHKLILPLAIPALLTGCDQQAQKSQPANHYQMAPVQVGHGDAEQSAVVVLDTQSGAITLCRAGAAGMECTLGTTSFP
jgi:hypothetical protein